jgi:hypothetical protein
LQQQPELQRRRREVGARPRELKYGTATRPSSSLPMTVAMSKKSCATPSRTSAT